MFFNFWKMFCKLFCKLFLENYFSQQFKKYVFGNYFLEKYIFQKYVLKNIFQKIFFKNFCIFAFAPKARAKFLDFGVESTVTVLSRYSYYIILSKLRSRWGPEILEIPVW